MATIKVFNPLLEENIQLLTQNEAATAISADTSNFGNELSTSETNVQLALDRLDDYDSLLDWATGKTYRVGNVVRVTAEGFIGEWRCIVAHTAAAAFSTDVESGKWEIIANSEGSRELVTQAAHGFVFGDEVYHTGSAYAKAQADSAVKAEAVGMVLGVTTNKFVLGKTGKATKAGWGLTAGAVYFLSADTAGLITTTEPSVVGQISKPVGIAVSTTEMQLLHMRGATVGGTNLYSTISLANNTTTSFHTIQGNAGTGGWLSGTIKIAVSSGTSYTIPVFVMFSRQQDGTTYNVTAQFGSDIPSGLSITNSGSSIQVVLPNVTNFSSASITYCVQAAASGTTLPVSVSASAVLGSTSGVAPAAGVIGQKIPFTARTVTGSSGAWAANSTALATLTAGVWSVRSRVSFSRNNTASYVECLVSTNTTADPSGKICDYGEAYNQVTGAANIPECPMMEVDVVVSSGSTPLYAKCYGEDGAVNVTINGFAIRIG